MEQTKICNGCKEEKPLSDYSTRRDKNGYVGVRSYCKACSRLIRRAWVKTHDVPDYHKLQRAKVLAAYGGKCACCGEDGLVFLGLHHVNGGGVKHRKDTYTTAHYKDAKDRNYPPDYEVLCHNCHAAKDIYGSCPHLRSALVAA